MSKTILIAATELRTSLELAKFLSTSGHSVVMLMIYPDFEKKDSPNLVLYPNVEIKEVRGNQPKLIHSIFKDIEKRYDNIDVFLNHISYAGLGTLQTSNIDEAKSIWDVALWNPMDLVKEVIPLMRRYKEGLIINLMYGSHLYAIPFLLTYEISKAAIEGLTKCIRSEIQKYNIDVISIYQERFPPEVKFVPHCNTDSIESNRECYPFQVELERYAKMVSYSQESLTPDLHTLFEIIISQINNKREVRPTHIVFNPVSGEGLAYNEESNNSWIDHLGLREL